MTQREKLLSAGLALAILTFAALFATVMWRQFSTPDDVTGWKLHFRVLDGWVVRYEPEMDECKTVVHRDVRQALIYGCGDQPDDYMLHEMLHVAVEAGKHDKEENEELVKDLTKLIQEGP